VCVSRKGVGGGIEPEKVRDRHRQTDWEKEELSLGIRRELVIHDLLVLAMKKR